MSNRMPSFPPHSFDKNVEMQNDRNQRNNNLGLNKYKSKDIIYTELEREDSEMTMMNFDNNRNDNTNRSSLH